MTDYCKFLRPEVSERFGAKTMGFPRRPDFIGTPRNDCKIKRTLTSLALLGMTARWKTSLRAPSYVEGRGNSTPWRRVLILGKNFYVYIMTNQNHTVLYTGVTNELRKRVWQHKQKLVPGFTKRYNVNKLVYYEICEDSYQAIVREKQIKDGSRRKKMDLIDKMNPDWKDLAEEL